MPLLSCGGMRYQYKWQDVPGWQIPQDSQRNLAATINRAVEVGINHIETARGYGTSELQLGKILPTYDRDRLIVQTKVTPQDNAKEFQRKFEKSLANLKLDYVDLLSLHGINEAETFHQSMRPGGCLEIAQKLQAQGKVRFIGFSTHGATETIVQTIETNQFDYVNLHWYYIRQDNRPAIERALAHDMGEPAAALAVAWCIAQGDHVIPIPGTRSTAHLAELVRGAEISLSPGDLEAIDRVLPVGWAHGDRYSEDQWKGPEKYC